MGTASPIDREIIELDADTAAWTVSLFAIPNAVGRIFFGWFADRFTSRNAALVSYVLAIVASIMMLCCFPLGRLKTAVSELPVAVRSRDSHKP